jgi:hypothetical protein
MEGYFVRTLGMHRVYNSAFMNMLRDEENAKYRSYLKKTIEFDPDILKRYVNFMSNPDERTAIDQFGTGDKYFGVCTLLATLPGLPMFGHGQIEGFTERYGMEFKQARMDEWPNEDLVARHQREIAPLLKKRHIFAGSSDFTLYDFWDGYGTVNENVFAYSNRCGGERSLVVYNNKYDSTRGTIHSSAAFMDKGSGSLRQRSLADGLGLPGNESLVISYRDTHGLEYLRRATEIHRQGLSFDLRGFQCVTLLDWRELWPNSDWPWDRLCDTLQGRGVPSVHEELARLRLSPLHDTLRNAVSAANVHLLAQAADNLLDPPATNADQQDDPLGPIVEASRLFYQRIVETFPELSSPAPAAPAAVALAAPAAAPTSQPDYADAVRTSLRDAAHLPLLPETYSADWAAESRPVLPGAEAASRLPRTWAPILAWIVLRSLPAHLAAHGDLAELFDRIMLRSTLADIFQSLGMAGESRWQAAAQVRVLLTPAAASPDAIHTAALWADPDVRWLAGVNVSAGATWFNKEQFEELLTWLQLPALIEIAAAKSAAQVSVIARVADGVVAAREAADLAGYNLERYLAGVDTEPDDSLPPIEPELAPNP